MVEQASFYFGLPAAYDPQAIAKFWGPEAPARYAALIKRIEAQEAFDTESLEALYRGLAAEMGLKLVDLAQLTRIALTGKTASPPIFQVAAILGKRRDASRACGSAHKARVGAHDEPAPPRAPRPVGVECRAALPGRPGRRAVRAWRAPGRRARAGSPPPPCRRGATRARSSARAAPRRSPWRASASR